MPVFVDQEGTLRGVGESVAELQAARAKGWTPRDAQVSVLTRQGEYVPVASENLDAWLTTGDVVASGDSQREVQAARREELLNKADSFAGGLEAFGRGGARTILPGIDKLLGDEEYAQLLREEYSTLDTLGTATGLLASIGAGGGLGSVSRGVGVLGGAGGLSTRLAIGAGKGLSKKLGGKAAGKIAGFAAEGAVENTLFEAGAALNDAILLGDEFDVESVGSRLFTSGLLGAGIGGVFGAGAAAGNRILRKADAAESALNPTVIGDEVKNVAARIDANLRGPDFQRMIEKRADQLLTESASARAKRVSPDDSTIPDLKAYDPTELGRVPEVSTSPRQDSTGAQGPAGVRKRQAAIRNKKAQELRARDEARIAQRVADAESFEVAAAKLDQGRVPETIAALEDVAELSPADAIAQARREVTAMKNQLRALNRQFQNLDIGKLYRSNNAVAMGEAIEKMDKFQNLIGRFDELNGTTTLDDLLGSEAFAPLRNLQDTQFDNVLQDLLPGNTELGTLLQRGLKAGQSFKKAEAALQLSKTEARSKSIKQGILEGVAGAALFGPAWGAVGIAGMGWRFLRYSYGARRAAANGISAATRKFMQKAGKSGLRRAVNSSARAAVSKVHFGKKDKDPDPVKARINEIRALSTNPEARANIESSLAPIMAYNPGFGMQLADAAVARLNYYMGMLPTGPMPASPLYADMKWEPSADAVDRFTKMLYAGEFPQQALEEMLVTGRIDPIMVDTIKTLYPRLWDAQRESIVEHLVENPQPLSYDKRYALTRLYDIPLEPTADPVFGARLQTKYAQQDIEQRAPTTSSPEMATPTKAQRLADR